MEFTKEDLINIRGMKQVTAKRTGPVVDELVSKAVGKQIYTSNPKLIAKIAEWKQQKGDNDVKPGEVPKQDNFLDDPKKVEELKKIL